MPLDHSPDKNFLADLSRFQRLLLITDGTVTDMLEQYLQEKIQLRKLHEATIEQVSPAHLHARYLADMSDTPMLERKVLLHGERSQTNWVYAESVILLEHLPAAFRNDLLHQQEPIGRLWEKYRIETFKQIVHFNRHAAGELADYFAVSKDTQVIARTYTVYTGGLLIMLITEVFPTTFFCD